METVQQFLSPVNCCPPLNCLGQWCLMHTFIQAGSSFRVKGKLGGEYRDFPHPSFPQHFPIINILHWEVQLLQEQNKYCLTVMRQSHIWELPSSFVPSVGQDKQKVTCAHLYFVTQNSLTGLSHPGYACASLPNPAKRVTFPGPLLSSLMAEFLRFCLRHGKNGQ